MSLLTGGRLETAGQVRNVYDMLCTYFPLTVAWSSGTHVTTVINMLGRAIPFDTGPDKPSRVFVRIHGVEILLSTDVPGAGVVADGWLYYQAPNKKSVYLAAIRQSLATNVALSVNRAFFSDYGYNAENVNDIGAIGFENNASALGAASVINMLCRVNVGIYGIYSEPDFDLLMRVPPHEHSGLPYGIDIQE